MLLSMTGFGKDEVTFEHKSFSVQLKSVNSKTADLSIKIPGPFREKENEIRSNLIKELQRGKIELYISTQAKENNQSYTINNEAFNAYYSALKKLSLDKKISDDTLFSLASKMPNVLSQESESIDENEWVALSKGIDNAIKELKAFRATEGKGLENDLKKRVSTIQALLEKIKDWEKERVDTIKSKLESQLNQVNEPDKINRDRLEQELIYYFEKLDITEEKVRLKSHCDLFNETINQTESQGRKLGFIAQEMGREINTIGSKANNSNIQKVVVEMKDELEKIKEQLFNIL